MVICKWFWTINKKKSLQSKYCMKIQIPIYFDTCSNYGSNQGYTMQPTGITEHWRRKENKFHEEMNKEKQTHFMSKGKQTNIKEKM